ncbi:MAG: hypothetical protein Q7T85_01580 [Nitrosomonas sp.]|nr:hypothetical protein [Nitrosomonas sp.]
MYCLIKEWPNKMATLMTEDGVVLWTFSDIEEARKVWQDWCSLQNDRVTSQIQYLGKSGLSEQNIP